jgi:Tfp pilus assembly protein PilO
MTPKKLFYVLLALTGLGIVGTGYGYYWANGLLGNATSTLSKQLAARDDADTTIAQLIHLQRQYSLEVTPILPQLDSILPHTKNQSQILLQLQTIANNAGLSIRSLTLPTSDGLPSATSQTIAAGGVLALPVTFSLGGSYNQLQTFLTQVENLDRFTSVTSLSIQHSSTQPITYAMTINAYIKP